MKYFRIATAVSAVLLNGFIIGALLDQIFVMPWQMHFVLVVFTGANIVNAFCTWKGTVA